MLRRLSAGVGAKVSALFLLSFFFLVLLLKSCPRCKMNCFLSSPLVEGDWNNVHLSAKFLDLFLLLLYIPPLTFTFSAAGWFVCTSEEFSTHCLNFAGPSMLHLLFIARPCISFCNSLINSG